MPTAQRADVVIVGGGAIGLSTAWRAAGAGLEVIVVDPEPARGASWAAAGMLAPVTEVVYEEDDLLHLTLASAERYADFVAELEEASGHDVGYRRCGTVFVARTGDDMRVLDDLHDYQQRLGLDVERLGSRECRELEPLLVPSVRGGLYAEGDHAIDNRRLVEALRTAAERAGATIVEDRVEQVRLDDTGDRTTGVALGDGRRIDADTVVVAAGAWSGRIGGIPDVARPPVHPVRGELLYLRAAPDERFIEHNVRGVVHGESIYLVARGDGRFVVGATVEEQGFDSSVTVGGVWELLRDARELLPSISELELIETVAGLRPGSPDNAPILGTTPVDGLVLATGHYRNGIVLTPVTSEAITALLVDGKLPDVATPFTLDRFETS